MLRYILFALVLVVMSSCSSKIKVASDHSQSFNRVVGTLASDMMEGRETGTEGEVKAAAFLGSRMRSIGLTPKGDGSSFLQNYRRKYVNNPHEDASEVQEGDRFISGNNVVGYLDNGAAYTVIIGAHYDHLGMGGPGSLHAGEPAIHNGADDNASGVAIMLGLAEEFIKRKDKRYNYLFIAFSGEEKGLWGSSHYAKNPTIDLSKVSYMINMDMVGRLNEERQLAIHGTGTSPVWDDIIDGINKPIFKIKKDESGIGPSDHTSFYLQDIPVLHFFTGQHEHYHKPSDDIEHINWSGMQDITSFILSIIAHTDHKNQLAFTKTASRKEDVPDFKVTLGVMPDYLYDGEGMRIDGVREGRPAHGAQLVKGDIVMKMGEYDVKDMMSYMECLSKFEPGQTVEVVVKRDNELVSKSVTF